MISETSKPYYAVIFLSRHGQDISGYAEMSEKMTKLAMQQPGYMGHHSARSDVGITVSYWESLEAIRSWKQNSEHLLAQQKGRSQWYPWYHVRICEVLREYDFSRGNTEATNA